MHTRTQQAELRRPAGLSLGAALLIAGCVCLPLLPGCGGGSDGETTATATPVGPEPEPESEAAPPEPEAPDRRAALQAEIDALNAQLADIAERLRAVGPSETRERHPTTGRTIRRLNPEARRQRIRLRQERLAVEARLREVEAELDRLLEEGSTPQPDP